MNDNKVDVPPVQMQLHFEPQSAIGNQSETVVESLETTVASNVVIVDFSRSNSQENSASPSKSDSSYLGQVLERARRLSW
ncbi:MAG: hypothetical protein ACKO0Z_23605 [Betaproteobacteria bacterium]